MLRPKQKASPWWFVAVYLHPSVAPESKRRWSRWCGLWVSCPGLCCPGRCRSGGHMLSASTYANAHGQKTEATRYNLVMLWNTSTITGGCAVWLFLPLTCKQSSEVMTIRGHLDWQASSNGKKYLSASMKLVLDLIGGKVLEPDLLSPLGGLRKKREWDRNPVQPVSRSPQKKHGSKISLTYSPSSWHVGMTNALKVCIRIGMFHCTEQALLIHNIQCAWSVFSCAPFLKAKKAKQHILLQWI